MSIYKFENTFFKVTIFNGSNLSKFKVHYKIAKKCCLVLVFLILIKYIYIFYFFNLFFEKCVISGFTIFNLIFILKTFKSGLTFTIYCFESTITRLKKVLHRMTFKIRQFPNLKLCTKCFFL